MIRKSIGFLTIMFALTSCFNYSGPDYEIHYDAFVLNQGNFSAKNASLSVIDEINGGITNNLYESGNAGATMNSTAQDIAFSSYGSIYTLCATPDIIYMLYPLTYKKAYSITDGLKMPRNMFIKGNYMYVTNYGDEIETDNQTYWDYTKSFVGVYSISDNRFLGKVELDLTNAEDIICTDMYGFVTTKEGIAVLDITNSFDPGQINIINTIKCEDYDPETVTTAPAGRPKHMQILNGNSFAVSFDNGIGIVDISKRKIVDFFPMEVSYDGFITTNTDGTMIYSIYSDWAMATSRVDELDLANRTISKISDGSNITAVGVSPFTGNIYVANTDASYSAPSTIYVYGKDGNKITEYTAGIASSRFLFIGYQTEKED